MISSMFLFNNFWWACKSLLPCMPQICGATMLNLSLLTSDMWAVLIRIFAYHEKVCPLHPTMCSDWAQQNLFMNNTWTVKKCTHGACLHMARSTGSTLLLLPAQRLASSSIHTSTFPFHHGFSYGLILAHLQHGSRSLLRLRHVIFWLHAGTPRKQRRQHRLLGMRRLERSTPVRAMAARSIARK
jgi:hypothetical protein